MDNNNERLIVNKDSGRIYFFLFGLFQVGSCIFILFILIINVNNYGFLTQNVWIKFFLLFLLIFSLPAGVFALTSAFGDRKLIEIDVNGIKIKNQPNIEWENIFEIETRKYPGPRMSFYRIKITQDYDRKTKKIIWFSSDTKPNWTEIIDCLSSYTARHNISLA